MRFRRPTKLTPWQFTNQSLWALHVSGVKGGGSLSLAHVQQGSNTETNIFFNRVGHKKIFIEHWRKEKEVNMVNMGIYVLHVYIC